MQKMHMNGGELPEALMGPDLFSYPYTPGHRGVDTSIIAANKIQRNRGRKEQCYKDILRILSVRGELGATTRELVKALPHYGKDYLQPRTSELSIPCKKTGRDALIVKDGKRDVDGHLEGVWHLVG